VPLWLEAALRIEAGLDIEAGLSHAEAARVLPPVGVAGVAGNTSVSAHLFGRRHSRGGRMHSDQKTGHVESDRHAVMGVAVAPRIDVHELIREMSTRCEARRGSPSFCSGSHYTRPPKSRA
jgi:hypothetical protein